MRRVARYLLNLRSRAVSNYRKHREKLASEATCISLKREASAENVYRLTEIEIRS